ncbi:hypothetical protein [Luteibacter sp.]|uniref:PIN-like domain-containing protein n=1 Tax=Luteibacter sp. TaxID=1886636 RepID=UPI0039C90946
MRAQLDENLPPALARALHCLAEDDGHSVTHVTAVVPRGTPDVELLLETSKLGVHVHITQDHHHRRPNERDTIATLSMAVFVLAKGWQGQPFFDKAARLVQWWPRIVEQAEATKPPAIFLVPWSVGAKGRFERIKVSSVKTRR